MSATRSTAVVDGVQDYLLEVAALPTFGSHPGNRTTSRTHEGTTA
jgi:hypothetical protein